MSWQQQLESVGLNESNMPDMIRKPIKDLYRIQSAIDEINEALEDDELSERKRGQLENELETLEESIEEQEEVIEKKIAQWDKNKEMYRAKGERLKAAVSKARESGAHVGRPKKQQPSASATATQTAQNEPPIPNASSGVVVTNGGTKVDEPQVVEKKKGGWGFMAIALVVAVVTAGAVILNKNE